MDSDKYFRAKQIYFFVQRNELYVEEDYQFLPTFKKQIYPGKNFHTKNSVFEFEYTPFNQRKEIYVKEDYQLCHLLKKYTDKYFHTKKFQFLKFEKKKFSIKGTNCMRKKTINFCHLSKKVFREKLPCQKISVFEISYTFFN